MSLRSRISSLSWPRMEPKWGISTITGLWGDQRDSEWRCSRKDTWYKKGRLKELQQLGVEQQQKKKRNQLDH